MNELVNRWDEWSAEHGEASIRDFFRTLQGRELHRLVQFIRDKPKRNIYMPDKVHGDARRGKKNRLLRIWYGMRNRCRNEVGQDYRRYGGRGILICKEWDTYLVFKDWALANGYDETLTLDRINVDGNYEPSNCRWATIKQQSANRGNNVQISFNGRSMIASEWASELGIKECTITSRISEYGWSIERALTTPTRIRNRMYARK